MISTWSRFNNFKVFTFKRSQNLFRNSRDFLYIVRKFHVKFPKKFLNPFLIFFRNLPMPFYRTKHREHVKLYHMDSNFASVLLSNLSSCKTDYQRLYVWTSLKSSFFGLQLYLLFCKSFFSGLKILLHKSFFLGTCHWKMLTT